jgi:hypothetical protein
VSKEKHPFEACVYLIGHTHDHEPEQQTLFSSRKVNHQCPDKNVEDKK